MQNLNFNIYAFTKPSNRAEVSALLDEAICVAKDFEDMVESMSEMLATNATRRTTP